MKVKLNLSIDLGIKETLINSAKNNKVTISQYIEELVKKDHDENWMKFKPDYLKRFPFDSSEWEIKSPPELYEVEEEINRLEASKLSIDTTIMFLKNLHTERSKDL